MNKLHNWINTGLIALVIVLGLVGGNQSEPAPKALGGSTDDSWSVGGNLTVTGSTSVTGETVVEGFTQGGGVGTLTDANGGTYTLTQAELLASNYLKFAAGGAGQEVVALTLPATSTMTTLIPTAGQCRTWIYDATALAAATTTTVTAGTGHDLVAYTTNDDVIDGNEFAEITMCRQSDGDVTTFTSEILHAD
jgi:hypothetical protein